MSKKARKSGPARKDLPLPTDFEGPKGGGNPQQIVRQPLGGPPEPTMPGLINPSKPGMTG